MKKPIFMIMLLLPALAAAQTDPVADLEARTYDLAEGKNGILYLGTSVGLMIVDASDPNNIKRVGRLVLPDNINSIEAHDDFVIASGGSAGLSFIDVSDPAKPLKLFSIDTSGSVQCVKSYRGSLLVCDGGMGLRILRVDNNAVIKQAWVRLQGFAKRMAISGDHAFIASDHGGLACIDLTDMTLPKLLWLKESPDRTRDVAVAGNLLLSAEGRGGMRIYDISDIMSPKLLKTIPVKDVARFVTVYRGTAYLSDGPDGIHIANLGNGSNAEVTGHLATDSAALGILLSRTATNVLFLAMDSGGVKSINIADNKSLKLINQD